MRKFLGYTVSCLKRSSLPFTIQQQPISSLQSYIDQAKQFSSDPQSINLLSLKFIEQELQFDMNMELRSRDFEASKSILKKELSSVTQR